MKIPRWILLLWNWGWCTLIWLSLYRSKGTQKMVLCKVRDSFDSGSYVSMIKRSALPKGVITKLLRVCKFPGAAFLSWSLQNLYFATHITFYFYYFCTWEHKKLTILQYHAILYVGIELFEEMKTCQTSKILTTLVEPFAGSSGMAVVKSQYPCGTIFVMGWPRALLKVFG